MGMDTTRSYRDLIVWNKAVEFTVLMYKATAQLPPEEAYGLAGQLRRACVSIPSNIAEGNQRSTTQDYLRFCRIALGSSGEVDTQLEICKRLGYLAEGQSCKLHDRLVEIRRMLMGLIGSLKARQSGAGKVCEDESVYEFRACDAPAI